jgi:hypothetical protein
MSETLKSLLVTKIVFTSVIRAIKNSNRSHLNDQECAIGINVYILIILE